MPKSATGRNSGATTPAAGFSLIELLVVLAVVAAMTGAVVVAFPDLGGRRTDARAEQLQRVVELACQRALMSGRDVGIAVARQQLGFGHFDDGGYQPIVPGAAEALRPRRIDEPLGLALRVDGRPQTLPAELPAQPQLVCTSSGERLAFELDLIEGGRPVWRVSAASVGAIGRERLDAR